MNSEFQRLNHFLGSVDGENRCLSGSCVTEKKFPVKTAAFVSLATALVIMVILVLIFVLKKKKSPNSEGIC